MIRFLPYLILFNLLLLSSCRVDIPESTDTYFGGEIINPKSDHVLLLKDNVLIDSIPLDENNRFFYKFSPEKEGLYNFSHDEYQYVYIAPRDSIFIRINTIDFDESLTFTGIGAPKNNFFIKTFLYNEKDEGELQEFYKLNPENFSKTIDKELDRRIEYLERHQIKYNFTPTFYEIAKDHIVFHYYKQKEYYGTYNHKYRDSIDDSFYTYRNQFNLNNPEYVSFYPYHDYISALINNLNYDETRNNPSKKNKSQYNLHVAKIQLIDSLISDSRLKNKLLKKTALEYLSKIECKHNAQKFYDSYVKYSTNASNNMSIQKVVSGIRSLEKGNKLPDFEIITPKNDTINFHRINSKPVVVYFWSSEFPQHVKSVRRKIKQYQSNTNYAFVGLSVDDNFNDWKTKINRLNYTDNYLIKNQKKAKEMLLLHKIQKTFVLDENGIILNSNLNLFDARFEEKLASIK